MGPMVCLSLAIAGGVVLGAVVLFFLFLAWALIDKWQTDKLNAYHQEAQRRLEAREAEGLSRTALRS